MQAGIKNVEAIFPDDFSGANIDTRGTYIVKTTLSTDISILLMEVKDTPDVAFVVMADSHYDARDATKLARSNHLMQHFQDDVNNEEYFPLPDFVVKVLDTQCPSL